MTADVCVGFLYTTGPVRGRERVGTRGRQTWAHLCKDRNSVCILAGLGEGGGEECVPGEDTAASLLPHFTSALRHVGCLCNGAVLTPAGCPTI